jgi:hypothetical protein
MLNKKMLSNSIDRFYKICYYKVTKDNYECTFF